MEISKIHFEMILLDEKIKAKVLSLLELRKNIELEQESNYSSEKELALKALDTRISEIRFNGWL